MFRGWGVAIETKSSSYDVESAPIATYRWLHLDCEGIRRFIIYSRCSFTSGCFSYIACHNIFCLYIQNDIPHPEIITKEAEQNGSREDQRRCPPDARRDRRRYYTGRSFGYSGPDRPHVRTDLRRTL